MIKLLIALFTLVILSGCGMFPLYTYDEVMTIKEQQETFIYRHKLVDQELQQLNHDLNNELLGQRIRNRELEQRSVTEYIEQCRFAEYMLAYYILRLVPKKEADTRVEDIIRRMSKHE
jgi:hypothetical protein